MTESLKGLKTVVPKARASANALVTKCVRARGPVFEKSDRTVLWKVVVALALLFVSDVATMIAIILELAGFGRGAWLKMALVAIVCSFTTTRLMVQDMMSNSTPHILGDSP